MAIFRTIPAGDVALVGGTFQYIDGPEFVRQKLAARFKFFLGEWFLDRRQGVPYFRHVFVKKPNIPVIRLLFRRIITTTPGVVSLKRYDLTYSAAERRIAQDFEAIALGGVPIIVTPADQEFIVEI